MSDFGGTGWNPRDDDAWKGKDCNERTWTAVARGNESQFTLIFRFGSLQRESMGLSMSKRNL